MRVRVVLFGVVGTVATLLAAGLLFAPETLLSVAPVAPLVTLGEAANARQLLLGGSLLAGLYLLVAARSATLPSRDGEGGDAFDAATAEPPEAVTTARQRRTGAALAATIDDAIAGEDEALDAVRERFRETATAAYAQTAGCGPEAARRAVERGDWTDDRTAAAVLSGDDGPSHSLWSRLRLWLDPAAERRRRLHRTVSATRGLTEGWP
ncbi:hypothetical protein ACAH01_15390 [Halomicrobium sp. HM KBTZ05]|uniref:DUF7269 family protein n=1 Tax=Halomicrobium sp. HM KBTZ05 TaxID=3242663 RepID=UPI0035577D9D